MGPLERLELQPMIRVGLVGLGAMGANHLRALRSNPRCEVVCVVDNADTLAQKMTGLHGIDLLASVDLLPSIDAAIVASSTPSHFDITTDLLHRGIPTLVEKPMVTSADSVLKLLGLAESSRTVVMCGFVERFNPVVMTAMDMLDSPILHLRTQRQSPPAGRHSSNAIWDLLIHDLDLALRLLPGVAPENIYALGNRTGGTRLESIEGTFHLGKTLVNTMCSRLWQRKVRAIEIATESTLLELDLLRQTITTYKNISQEQLSGAGLVYRSATTIDVPFVRHAGEPLALELDHFFDLVQGLSDPDVERESILLPHQLAEEIERLCL